MIIALWVVLSIVLFRRAHARMGFQALLAVCAYYVCTALWIYPSENRDAAWFAMEVKFSLLLFPLVWMFLPAIDARTRVNVLLALVWGCVAFVLIGVLRATWLFIESGDSGVFFYDQIAWYFHPTYLAAYDAFALVVLGRMHVKKVFTLSHPWLHYVLAALLIVHVGLLESKAGYLCILLAIGLVGLLEFQRTHKMRALLFIAAGAGVLTTVVLAAPSARNRVSSAFATPAAPQPSTEESANPELPVSKPEGSTQGRLAAWRAAIEYIAANPMGAGTGDVTDRLVEIYTREGENYARRKALNAHNQFLQAGVAFGWIGIAVLLLIFVEGFRMAFKRRDFIFLSFLLIMLLNMLFESFLEVQSGVVFFAFFFGFFVKSASVKV